MRALSRIPLTARWAGRFLVTLLLPTLGAGPARATTTTGLFRLFAITSGGYDDDILGRSAASASRADVTVAAGFYQASPVLDFRLGQGRWAATGSYAFLYNRFFEPEAGGYRDHEGELELRFRPSTELLLTAGGNLESFRRSRFDEYDLNHAEATFRAEAAPDPRLTLRGVLSLQQDHYPKSRVERIFLRPALTDTVDQSDTLTNLELSATLRPATGVTMEAGWVRLRTDSNVPRYGYDGRQYFVGATVAPLRAGTLAASWIYETRDYDTPPGIAGRRDHSDTWQIELRQRVAERLTAFCAGSHLDYHSSETGYSFDQSRVRAGLELRLTRLQLPGAGFSEAEAHAAVLEAMQAGSASGGAANTNGLSPRILADGVHFRCRAPDAAQVTLVGSFNGWSRTATRMTGPDAGGVWEVCLPLQPGTYRYMFYVDNTHWTKPEGAALYEDDGFGMTNGVLVVP